MTKTTQDMNNSIKFNVYSLKFKEMLRCGRGLRLMLLAALLLGFAGTAGAQDLYIIHNTPSTLKAACGV